MCKNILTIITELNYNMAVNRNNKGGRMKIRTIGMGMAAVLCIVSLSASAFAEGDKAKGADLYKKNCAGCHGLTGAGDGAAASSLKPKPASFVNKDAVNSLGKKVSEQTDEELATTISKGRKKTAMPAFKKLSEQEVKDLVAYVRSL